jgi:parallel beta-helix repeat protein
VVKVSGNTIELKDSGYGIWTQGADSITLSSNKINMNTPSNGDGKGNGDGIRSVNSTAVTIQSNTITHGKKTTKNKKACGILLDSNSDGIVKSNTINNSIVNGIKVQTKSKATIYSNKVNACGGDGIYVSSNATAPVIQSNTIKKCKKYGINYLNKKGKVTITKNKFSKNKKKLRVKAKGKIQKK